MPTIQKILQFLEQEAYKPLTFSEIVEMLNMRGQEEELTSLLQELESNGQVIKTKNERYGTPDRMNLIKGKVQGNAKGFAFVIADKSDLKDIYIHSSDMNGAMDGDIVLVRVFNKKKQDRRPEGEITRIVKRGRSQVVGVFRSINEHFGFVVPDDRRLPADIFIPTEHRMGAENGQKVVVKLSHFPSDRNSAEGEIIEIIGNKDDPGVDIVSIIRKHGLPEKFPPEVEEEAEAISETISDKDLLGRHDIRQRVMVTIDGEDAKDLDDAVSVERLPNGNIRLGVHIADVGYYVKEGSALDREAYERGCSVYLVDRVIPMLPKRLSNGICSLNPQVDRLTMTCDMEIDKRGEVVAYDIYPSVICTNERMTYRNVQKILEEHDAELIERYRSLVPHFELMAELADRLRTKRIRRGAVDFNFTEAKIIVDENGKPVDIVKRPRSVAERLIEEFMLSANETVAEHYNRLEVPFVYRIHENPDAEKLQSFYQFVTTFGYRMKGKADKVKPRALQDLLLKISGRPEETVISTVMLRSMKQAKYSTENAGHFGLAANFYSHFTSPIRRYPDLLIHRVMRELYNEGTLSSERMEQLQLFLSDASEQSSVRERVAVDAERETDDLKQAEFMTEHVGEEYEGTISGVTSFGIFVELENTIEGLVHVSFLNDDYYRYEEKYYCLIGERTGRVLRIGDKVKIKVSGVNMEERKIDFELLEHTAQDIPLPTSQKEKKKKKPVRKKPTNKATPRKPKATAVKKETNTKADAPAAPRKRRRRKPRKTGIN
ncbi:ribonuclease R [Shimazuella kribbensis]|uniref:ribonuclease R n=1 Tax=Shimazuella kribbensis TaxID=139808 RepID=UPI00040C94E2|nr:ribonuclease R [Shimazuella kribbensis]